MGASALRAAGEGEVSLYDSRGDAQAYIDSAGQMTIYLWSGEPVAYLEHKEGGIFDVWGFTGWHLGWFSEGILRDNKGYVVGAVKKSFNGPVHVEQPKMTKRPPPPKAGRDYSPRPPRSHMDWSKDWTLRTLLLQGKYD